MQIIEVSKDNFDSEVLKSKKVLVDFNASWCGPCKMLSPILEEVANTTDYKIVSVDVDAESDLASEYNVNSIPCLVLFENGKESKRSIGLIQKDDIIKLLGE